MTGPLHPLIGLSTYREQARWGVWDQPADLLPSQYADAVVRVRAREVVDDVQRVAPGEVLRDLRAQAVEMLLGQRVVHGAPPDAVA